MKEIPPGVLYVLCAAEEEVDCFVKTLEVTMRNSNSRSINFKRTAISAAVVMAMGAGLAQAAPQTFSTGQWFSMNNLVGGFDGAMLGGLGNYTAPRIVCGASSVIPGSPPCPTGEIAPGVNHPQPINGDQAPTLYPIDSEFGFIVVPFAEAFDKVRGDGIWGEGWVGNIPGGGLEFSDAETDTFIVPSGLGTWCTGLGGAAVKCSTERFVVMENVLTCHETIPYYYADPDTGTQLIIKNPVTDEELVNCADKKLDNNLRVLSSSFPTVDGKMTAEPVTTKEGSFDAIDWTQTGLNPDDILSFLVANESTILDDIAYGDDYSITAKDDGKPLYRWGNLIKRPNDIRIYARLATPNPWRAAGALTANGGKGYRVTKARLNVFHSITNNPNDQIRPEDMENEGAIGRLPGYTTSGNKWLSDRDCYQGNGVFIPEGTVLRNGDFAITSTAVPVVNWNGNPYAWSEDLVEGFTNGWATTVDREPFEWSYDTNEDGVDDISYPFPLPDNQVGGPGQPKLLSGPRWRLGAPKFGQDIPGLEIPNVQCAPPPYQKALIKYEVGEPKQVVIDLLDWDPADERSVNGESPLVWSKGWTDPAANLGNIPNPDVTVRNPNILAVSVNGAPITTGFDLSIYVKGDRKPTQVYKFSCEV
jgi:hypothetical protein